MNSINIIGTLEKNHKEEGEYLYVIINDGNGNMPTARFSGKQREAMIKWGSPGRQVAIAGNFGTEINGRVKNSFINVAYSRFLDKQEKHVAAPAPAPAPVVAAPAPAPAKAPSKAPSKGKKAASANATPPDDGMPF